MRFHVIQIQLKWNSVTSSSGFLFTLHLHSFLSSLFKYFSLTQVFSHSSLDSIYHLSGQKRMHLLHKQMLLTRRRRSKEERIAGSMNILCPSLSSSASGKKRSGPEVKTGIRRDCVASGEGHQEAKSQEPETSFSSFSSSSSSPSIQEMDSLFRSKNFSRLSGSFLTGLSLSTGFCLWRRLKKVKDENVTILLK